jgi:hypothetical protein
VVKLHGEIKNHMTERELGICILLTADVGCEHHGESLPVPIEVDLSSHLYSWSTIQEGTDPRKIADTFYKPHRLCVLGFNSKQIAKFTNGKRVEGSHTISSPQGDISNSKCNINQPGRLAQ